MRCTTTTMLLASVAVTAAGCGAHSVTTAVRRDQIGTKYARITGYLATRGLAPGGTHTEETPSNIRHDVILDEATLAKVDASETCVDLVMRTTSVYDEPVEQLSPIFEIDGEESRGVVESELVSVYDYSYSGEREVVSIAGVTSEAFLGLSITEPTENIFRVIERQARVCAGRGGQPQTITLAVTNPSWDIADYNYHLTFHWQVR